MVQELTECMNDLSEQKDASNYGRFNKWGAKALLANVYLNAEVYTGTPQWEACIKECNDILNSGQYQLESDYLAPFKVYNEGSVENIFVIPLTLFTHRVSKFIKRSCTLPTKRLISSKIALGDPDRIRRYLNSSIPMIRMMSAWI